MVGRLLIFPIAIHVLELAAAIRAAAEAALAHELALGAHLTVLLTGFAGLLLVIRGIPSWALDLAGHGPSVYEPRVEPTVARTDNFLLSEHPEPRVINCTLWVRFGLAHGGAFEAVILLQGVGVVPAGVDTGEVHPEEAGVADVALGAFVVGELLAWDAYAGLLGVDTFVLTISACAILHLARDSIVILSLGIPIRAGLQALPRVVHNIVAEPLTAFLAASAIAEQLFAVGRTGSPAGPLFVEFETLGTFS